MWIIKAILQKNKNCLEHLLFALYLVLLAWLVTKIGFFTRAGLSSSQLVILFLLKVMAGILYGWIGVYYAHMAQMLDTWSYHQDSLAEYQLLRKKVKSLIATEAEMALRAGLPVSG